MALLPAINLDGTLVPLGLFVIYFAMRSKWHTSSTGRMFMFLAFGLIAVLCMGLLQRLWGPDFMDVLRVIVYSFLHIGAWRFFYSLRIVQRTNCDGNKEPTDLSRIWSAVAKLRSK